MPGDVSQYLDQSGGSVATRKLYLSAIRGLLVGFHRERSHFVHHGRPPEHG
jgi:hypothetical protein